MPRSQTISVTVSVTTRVNSGSTRTSHGSSRNNNGSSRNNSGSSRNNNGSSRNNSGSSRNNNGSSRHNSRSSQTNNGSSRAVTQRNRTSSQGSFFACLVRAWSRIPFLRRLVRHHRYFSQTVTGFRRDSLDRYIEELDGTAPLNSDGSKKRAGAKECNKATNTKAASSPAGSSKEEEEEDHDEKCSVCLDHLQRPTKLKLCGHVFCRWCLEQSFKVFPKCPLCNQALTVVSGNMPDGTMDVQWLRSCLPGYEDHGTIIITYDIPGGIQGENHSNPGSFYSGTLRVAYLPDNREGRMVCRLMWAAFSYRHIFTVGYSITHQRDNMVTWNDIHHKTLPQGGPERFGYPDPDYLTRVTEELAAKGITPEFIKSCRIPF